MPKSDSENDSLGTSASVTSLSDNSAPSSRPKPASFAEDTHFVVSESSSSELSLIESPVCVVSEPNLLVHASSESSTSASGKDLNRPAASNLQKLHQFFKKPKTVQNVPKSDSKNDSVATSASVTSLSDNSAQSSTLKPASFAEDTHFVDSESSSFESASFVESSIHVAPEPLTPESTSSVHGSSVSSTSVSGKQSLETATPPRIDQPFQPTDTTFKFPLRSFNKGKKHKRFNQKWFENKDWEAWLHYDVDKDAAFCTTCVNATRLNLISSNNAETSFISSGFTNWIDAGTKNRGFDKHCQSNAHKEAHDRLHKIPNDCGSIADQLTSAFNEERSVNQQNLLKILSNVRFLARQALPLRGHGSGEDSNFTQLYILREEDNEGLKAWRTEKKTDKYVHSTMQNDMMKVMALQVLRDIAGSLHDADFFSMMGDEATDTKNVIQLVVCLRWVDENLDAHDEFIGLKKMATTDAESIVEALKEVLRDMSLQLRKCRGQCYDGCSTMSGYKNGVAVKIKAEEIRALYTHCYCHSINLAVGDTMKNCPVLKDTIDNTYELTKLVKKSPKREAKLRDIQGPISKDEDNEDEEYEALLRNPTIKLFCHTRWTVRADCLKSVIANFKELQELWDWSLVNCSCSEMKGRIQGIKVHSRKFSFCFGIHLAEMILAHTDNLNRTLQGAQMTANDAQAISRACVATLQSLRDKKSFDLFWAKINTFANKHDIEQPQLQRRRKPTIKTMFGKAQHEHPEKIEDEYRRKYYTALDTIITCIKDRFVHKTIFPSMQHWSNYW